MQDHLTIPNNQSQSIIRPGVSAAYLALCGVRRGEDEEGRAGIVIPFTQGGTPIVANGQSFCRVRLDEPIEGRKYSSPKGSRQHAWLPPAFPDGDWLTIVEGEFKAMALNEAGFPAIGIAGFYADPKDKLICEISDVLLSRQWQGVYFVGDTDTCLNWQFSDAVLRLKKHLGPLPLKLPRIPYDQPKGADDLRAALGDGFADYWKNRLANALDVEGYETDPLAVELLHREFPHLEKLEGADREAMHERLCRMAALIKEPLPYNRLKAIAASLGLGPRQLEGTRKQLLAEARAKLSEKGDARPKVQLPKDNRLAGAFAEEVAKIIAPKHGWFMYQGEIVTVENSDHPIARLRKDAAITSLEKWVQPGHYITVGTIEQWIQKSASRDQMAALLASETLRSRLPVLRRVLKVPVPLLDGNTLHWPVHGFNPSSGLWLDFNAPTLTPLPLEQSKALLDEVLQDFPFCSARDKANAIGYLLTPFCRGLMPRWNCLCPLFAFEANRPRSGKDYLAGIAGILYHGKAVEMGPIGDSEEMQKIIATAINEGRTRLHFSNCKGHINNSVLEALVTSTTVNNRLLGSSKSVEADNEFILSFSGNEGDISVRPDLAMRCRKIRLAYFEEDGNSRTFSKPDLHGWIFDNREVILSALAGLVLHWHRQGMPPAPSAFSSFPQWGQVVGGVVHAAGYGDCCLQDDSGLIAIDRESASFKLLFAECHRLHGEKPVASPDILQAAKVLQRDEADIFGWLDLDDNNKGDERVFGMLLTKVIGRIFGGIRMELFSNHERTNRRKYRFLIPTIPNIPSEDEKQSDGKNIPTIPNIPKAGDKPHKISGILGNHGSVSLEIKRERNIHNVNTEKNSIYIIGGKPLPLLPSMPPDAFRVPDGEVPDFRQAFHLMQEPFRKEGNYWLHDPVKGTHRWSGVECEWVEIPR